MERQGRPDYNDYQQGTVLIFFSLFKAGALRRFLLCWTAFSVLCMQSAYAAGCLPPLAACRGHLPAVPDAPAATHGHGRHMHDDLPARSTLAPALLPPSSCDENLCAICRAVYGAHLTALPLVDAPVLPPAAPVWRLQLSGLRHGHIETPTPPPPIPA